MEPERRQRVKDLFDAALKRASSERRAFLDRACAGDSALADEVLSLLQSFAHADSVVEPAPASASDTPTEEPRGVTLLGRRVGPYQLIREIAEGGMGVVYLATRADRQYQKRVAIKLIRATLDREEIVRRFQQEQQTLAALDHPNIVKLLDGGTTEEGLPFLVMDYIEGSPIDGYCKTHRLSTTERLRLFLGVCAAVQYAHQNLVVHRDLKPSNILITADGTPKLLDFGIAKLLKPEFSVHTLAVTQTGVRPMTLEYASPEQIRGEPITTASDVYALGVVLYQLLTGHSPYRVKTPAPFELERAICEEEPDKPSAAVTRVAEPAEDEATGRLRSPERASRTFEGAPARLQRRLAGDLDTIILKALCKEPQRRYASVEQFAEDIRRHLENLPVVARKPTWRYRAVKFTRRHTAGVLAVVLVVLTLVGGVVATTWQARVARAEKARADQRFNDVRKLANSFLFEFHDAIQNLPGSTPARKLIVSKAREYLDSLAKEASGDLSLQTELAEAYLKVGDVQGYPYSPNLGDAAGALESYRKALSIAEALSQVNPQGATARRYLAHSYERIAEAVALAGRTSEAVENYRKALAIFEPLAASDPTDMQTRLDLARCYDSLGDKLGHPAFQNLGETAAAVESYRKSLTIYADASAADPSNRRARRGVAVGHSKIGDMLAAMGDTAAALENYRESLGIFEVLSAGDPSNADFPRSVGVLYERIGHALVGIGDVAGALENHRKSLAVDEALAAADPANAQARLGVASGLKNIGDLLAKTGDTAGALENYTRVLSIIDALSAADAANAQRRSQLSEMLLLVGSVTAKIGQPAEARRLTSRGLSILKASAEQSAAAAADLNAYALALLTCEPADLREPRAALRHAQRAAEKTNARNPSILSTLAQALAQTGDTARAIDTAQMALKLLTPSGSGRPVSGLQRELEERVAEWGRTRNEPSGRSSRIR